VSIAGTSLQLDVGNSSVKWRLVRCDQICDRGSYPRGNESAQSKLLNCTDTLDYIWIASVAAPAAEAELAQLLEGQWGIVPWFARTQARTGSLSNSYEDPGRMGVDRWLAMLGAREREQGRLCVIDAGSALTIDIVSASGRHEGGYIIPGAALMERALLLDTDRVRFDEEVSYALAPGTSTAAAVRHGIALAQAGAVALALDQAGGEPMALLFCGGAGAALMQLVNRGGQWLPDLVFEGLAAMAAASPAQKHP
jgi:type III pantothenate kinase